jgi:bifunctional DNA-binding transcriptional regulator/antitoxin component of YhaV-PrlF toxin-antitoxin module
MSKAAVSVVGRRGAWVIPAKLRRQAGIEEGTLVIADMTSEGAIRIRPAKAVPVRKYTPEQIAGFMLEGAVDWEDYQQARKRVADMGLDPDRIPHEPPPTTA